MNEWILSSSGLIAAVLLGRRLLRGKISLRLQYALWGIVLLRLLLPVQLFTSDYGAGTIAQDLDISEPIRQVYISANENRYEQKYDEAYRWAAATYESVGQAANLDGIERTAREMVRVEQEVDLKVLLTRVWLGGMAVMSAVIVFCNLHLSRRLKGRRWEYPTPDCLLPVYVTGAVPTPCMFGLFRPVIYLTPEASKDDQVRQHVLAHEQTHYRHADHIWSVLRSVCLVLHWYNPLVWLAVKISKADAELACDEGVLARLGESHRGDYGRTLIGLTCAAPIGDFLLTATTMTGSAGSIRERIRLLMKRPRNTVLTLAAVILIGTLVVGCAFSAAPETTEPNPSEPEDPIETQPATVSDFMDEDGILIYPGTEWGMTPEEVLTALNITEYGIMSGSYGFILFDQPFLDQKAEIAFYFTRHSEKTEWGLSHVKVALENGDAANAVWDELYQELGKPDFSTSGVSSGIWCSDLKIADLVSPEAYAAYKDTLVGDTVADAGSAIREAASSITWLGDSPPNPSNQIWFSGSFVPAMQIERTLGGSQTDQTTPILADFASDSFQPYYAYHTDELEYITSIAFTPTQRLRNVEFGELIATDATPNGVMRVLYAMDELDPQHPFLAQVVFWGDMTTYYISFTDENRSSRRFAVSISGEDGSLVCTESPIDPNFPVEYVVSTPTDLPYAPSMEQALAEYADKNPRKLNEKELKEFRAAFSTLLNDGTANPAACFLLPYYADISEMDGSEFLAYFPTEQEGTREEFDLLKAKYPEFFEHWTWENMPIPIHRYSAGEIEKVVSRYGNIHWAELDEGVHYLEETGCYYNYTSDFGLGGFYAKEGFVYDGGAVVYSAFSALFFTETNGNYTIQAHLPLLLLHSSNPMIPAG